MRPALRFAKKKKIHTPSGRITFHRLKDKSHDVCGGCGKPLIGKRRERAHRNLCSVCSRKMMKLKVENYVQ